MDAASQRSPILLEHTLYIPVHVKEFSKLLYLDYDALFGFCVFTDNLM